MIIDLIHTIVDSTAYAAIEITLGGAVLASALTFAVLYDRVDWAGSYVGRTTMTSTVGSGTLIGLTMIAAGLDLTTLADLLVTFLGVTAFIVLIRKTLALQWAQKKLRENSHEDRQQVVEHELDPFKKEEQR